MNHRLAVSLAGGLVVAVVAAPAGAADSVTRKSNQATLQGEITDISQTDITIVGGPRKTEEKIPANDIVRVRWDGEPPDLNVARNAERAGHLDRALEGYTNAAGEIAAGNTNLKADLDYLIARTTARIALADSSRREEAVEKLQAFRNANPNSFRHYELLDYLGQVQMMMGDFDAARSVFEEMAQAPWDDYKMAARIGQARVLLQQERFGDALEAFEAVIEMPGDEPAAVSRRHEARLGKATCLQRQQDFTEAIEVLDEVIQSVSPDDTAVQAEAYLRQGDSLRATGKTKEALLAYLHVDVLFDRETTQHAESLYHLAQLATEVGDTRIASDAAAKLQSEYANTEWAKRLTGGGE